MVTRNDQKSADKVKNNQPIKSTEHEEVQKLQAKVAELENNWKRALADYQNLKKRGEQEKSMVIRFASQSIIEKLLGVLDDLDLALEHHQETWVQLIRNHLHDIVKGEGVSEIEAAGKEFNPSEMECIEVVEGPKNTVTSVARAGYKMNDRIVRPARVRVGKGGESINK